MWEEMGREVWRLACSISETDGKEDLEKRKMVQKFERLRVYHKQIFYLKDFWILYMKDLVIKIDTECSE